MTAKPIFSRCMVIVALGILLLGIGGLPSQARELDPDPAATVRISEASDGTQANSSSGGLILQTPIPSRLMGASWPFLQAHRTWWKVIRMGMQTFLSATAT